jgi:hypothetical protein
MSGGTCRRVLGVERGVRGDVWIWREVCDEREVCSERKQIDRKSRVPTAAHCASGVSRVLATRQTASGRARRHAG